MQPIFSPKEKSAQIEDNTKQNLVFVFIVEMQPIFSPKEKSAQIERI